MKGTAKFPTNLKPMAGGLAIATLPVGGWVYGDRGLTDLTGFTHYYNADGSKVELASMCKATLGNLTLTNEAEPTEPTDPPPAGTGEIIHICKSMDGGQTYDAGIYYERLADA